MQRNQKLTKVIAGRIIKSVTTEQGSVSFLFDDQSSMKIKTAGAAAVSQGSKVKSVHEVKADFRFEFEDGSSATLSLANPRSYVLETRTGSSTAKNPGLRPWRTQMLNCSVGRFRRSAFRKKVR
jgi:hypothetical protein